MLLDSDIPGVVPGYLEGDQLDLLRRVIDGAGERFLLVPFHHYSVLIGNDWMDSIGLRNPQMLFDLLVPYLQVRYLLQGHIHQEFDHQRGPLRLPVSPSICAQLASGSSDFTLDRLALGYRWLRLHDDGCLETGIPRVDDVVSGMDYDTVEY